MKLTPALVIALTLAAPAARAQTLSPPSHDFRPHPIETCVDAAGQAAQCWLDADGAGLKVHYQEDCRGTDSLHRCSEDPLCHDQTGLAVTCTKPVRIALVRCGDGRLRPSKDDRCESNGGIAERLSPKAFAP